MSLSRVSASSTKPTNLVELKSAISASVKNQPFLLYKSAPVLVLQLIKRLLRLSSQASTLAILTRLCDSAPSVYLTYNSDNNSYIESVITNDNSLTGGSITLAQINDDIIQKAKEAKELLVGEVSFIAAGGTLYTVMFAADDTGVFYIDTSGHSPTPPVEPVVDNLADIVRANHEQLTSTSTFYFKTFLRVDSEDLKLDHQDFAAIKKLASLRRKAPGQADSPHQPDMLLLNGIKKPSTRSSVHVKRRMDPDFTYESTKKRSRRR